MLMDSFGSINSQNLWLRSNGVDMVIGYRALRRDAWHRTVNSQLGNWIARKFHGIRAGDINCAYKLMRREALASLPLRSHGAMISTELLALSGRGRMEAEGITGGAFPPAIRTGDGGDPQVILRTVREFLRMQRALVNS